VKLAAATLGIALAISGCGAGGYGTDVKGFTQQAKTPADREVLRSIATYRTTGDEKVACGLITPSFLKSRFESKPSLCEAVARHQTKRELPESAAVQSISGDTAKVAIDEPTATKSIYTMQRVGGTWKIDDIVEAP
jgi:hypothetical protein